jgi:MFS family permease
MTIPLTFLSERYGRKKILLLNLVPRLFMLFWTLGVAYFEDYLPPQAAIAGAALSVLGGDTVFNSLAYGLAAKITEDDTTRFVMCNSMATFAD